MDLKYVTRQLLRRPGHTLAVIACLVIGLVASVGTFSVITSLFYGDMPGISGRRSLARVFLRYDSPTGSEPGGGGRRIVTRPLSFNDFAITRELPADSAFDAIGAEGTLPMTAAGSHGPVAISGAFVSGDLFRTLRTTPLRGRLVSPEDDRPAAAPVAVVTEHFWRTHLDGRDDAIGRPVLLGGASFTVIGVAPPRFHGMHPLDPGQDDSNGVQAWIPLAHASRWPTRPSLDTGWLSVVGRVKAGLTTADVEHQLTVSAARIAASHPPSPRLRAERFGEARRSSRPIQTRAKAARLRRGHAEASAEAEPATRANASLIVRAHGFGPDTTPIQIFVLLAALLGLPLIVLAIGCANVANLHLARVAEQSRELAVRLALGATRARLVRLLTLETLARVLVAVGLSIGLILLSLERVQAMVPVFVSIDWRVLLFAVSLAVAVSLATGLMPAWIVLRRTAAGELKQGSQSGGLRHSRLRATLIVGQVALSLGLMVLAGLFARTVQGMVNEAPSALRQQMVATFDPSELRMTPIEARRFADTLVTGAAADRRVTHVALSIDDGVRFGLPSTPQTTDRPASLVGITAAWLDVMEVRLLTGRHLTDADDQATAMLSARAAEMIAPGASPLGMVVRVALGSSAGREVRDVRIVGVVADNPLRPTVERPDPVIYVPLPKEIGSEFTLRVRAADPEALRADLLSLVNRIDPRITWTSIRRGDMRFLDEAREMTGAVYVVSAAGAVALVLSATGLYAVLSYIVALRRREIGVRLAIGAQPSRIVTLVIRQALTLVLAGMACGLALAVPMAFAMRATFVANVTAADPMVFLPTIAVLVAVGILAAAVPAFRASRIDPIATLRQE
jgi:putative ABC transport system permease protein